jgi:flagellar basal body P-ring formation protein FlgA
MSKVCSLASLILLFFANPTRAEVVSLLVPVRMISPKEELGKDDFAWKQFEVNDVAKRNYLASFDQLDNKAAEKSLAAGRPVPIRALGPKLDIRKGETLPARFVADGIEIQGLMTAEIDGFIGDTIRVRNPETGTKLTAKVTPNRTLEVNAQ